MRVSTNFQVGNKDIWKDDLFKKQYTKMKKVSNKKFVKKKRRKSTKINFVFILGALFFFFFFTKQKDQLKMNKMNKRLKLETWIYKTPVITHYKKFPDIDFGNEFLLFKITQQKLRLQRHKQIHGNISQWEMSAHHRK